MMGWVSKQIENITNSTSKILGTDGSNKGLLQGNLQGASDVVSDLGKQVAEDPLAQTALTAAGMYFGVPKEVTAALLGVNSAGQKGDLMAGLRAGALSYGTSKAFDYFADPAKSVFGDSGATTAATTAEAGSVPQTPALGVKDMFRTITDTVGLGEDSKVTQTLGRVYEKVSSVGGDLWDTGANVIDRLGTWADKNPGKAAVGLQAIGGAFSAAQARELGEKKIQADRDLMRMKYDKEASDSDAYNKSFNLSQMAAPAAYKGPLRRFDGSLVYSPSGRLNRGA